MSDNNADIEVDSPDSYVVTVTRQFEMDIGAVMAKKMEEQSEAQNTEEALANSIAEVEASAIEPTQKLLNLDVSVNGPSDD